MDEWTQENFNDSSKSEHFFKVILYQIPVVSTRGHKYRSFSLYFQQLVSTLSGLPVNTYYILSIYLIFIWGFPGSLDGKKKKWPATQETWVLSLGLENPLGKGMTSLYNILACRIPWTEEPGGLQFMGLQRVGHD